MAIFFQFLAELSSTAKRSIWSSSRVHLAIEARRLEAASAMSSAVSFGSVFVVVEEEEEEDRGS